MGLQPASEASSVGLSGQGASPVDCLEMRATVGTGGEGGQLILKNHAWGLGRCHFSHFAMQGSSQAHLRKGSLIPHNYRNLQKPWIESCPPNSMPKISLSFSPSPGNAIPSISLPSPCHIFWWGGDVVSLHPSLPGHSWAATALGCQLRHLPLVPGSPAELPRILFRNTHTPLWGREEAEVLLAPPPQPCPLQRRTCPGFFFLTLFQFFGGGVLTQHPRGGGSCPPRWVQQRSCSHRTWEKGKLVCSAHSLLGNLF